MVTSLPLYCRTRQGFGRLASGRPDTPHGHSGLIRTSARLVLEEVRKKAERDLSGWGYYERGTIEVCSDRNDTRPTCLKAAEGTKGFSALRGAMRNEPFRTAIRSHRKGRMGTHKGMDVGELTRGGSNHNKEDIIRSKDGRRLFLSRSAASQQSDRQWEEYSGFPTCDLSDKGILYLFVDGMVEWLRPSQKREPVLVAWGYIIDGRKVLSGLMAGSKEDSETVCTFAQDMRSCGLSAPHPILSERALGIVKETDTCFPQVDRQHGAAHRLCNPAAMVPNGIWPILKACAKAVHQVPVWTTTHELTGEVAKNYERGYRLVAARFIDDIKVSVAHTRMLVRHYRASRMADVLERLFAEKRRRLDVIPYVHGEQSTLKQMYSTLSHVVRHYQPMRVLDNEQHQIERIGVEISAVYKKAASLEALPRGVLSAKVSSKSGA